MLRFKSAQIHRLEQGVFFERVRSFVNQRGLRPDFVRWLRNQRPFPATWLELWRDPCRLGKSEHDVALALVTLAVCQHASLACGTPTQLLLGLADNEMRVKVFLSDRGYFDFTAFDSPVYADGIED